jgi:HTH-type transcriptional regulator/antitoxin HigA
MAEKYIPNLAIPPGETIQEILDERGMTQRELADRLQVTTKHVNKLIKGTASLTYDMAIKMESVLDIPASFWNNLEMKYQDTLARNQALPQIEKETELLNLIPYNEMAKKGWVPDTRVALEKIKNLRSYFKVASLDCLPTIQAAAFRKSAVFSSDEYALAAWLNQCEIEALNHLDATAFSFEQLVSTLPKIRRLTTRPLKASWTELVTMCLEAGVLCVMVPPVTKAHVNGATKWLSNNRVMIAVTQRGGFEDIFWFTFFHEVGHIFQNKKNTVFVDIEHDEVTDLEKNADNFALDQLIPKHKYEAFLQQKNYLDVKKIRQFTDELGIHTGILVGRLMKENHIEFGDTNYLALRRKTST